MWARRADVSGMGTGSSIPGYQVRRVILVATAIVAFLSVLYEIYLAMSGEPGAPVRMIMPAALTVAAIWEMRHGMRVDFLPILIIVSYGLFGILDPALGTDFSSLDGTTTLAVLILVAVMYVASREKQSPGPVLAIMAFTGLYSVVTVLLGDHSSSQAIGILILGIPGQAMALWMVSRLIHSLDRASTASAKQAQVQRALARCSQALLSRGSDGPLETALAALLDATEADYAYIDVNRTDAEGHLKWEIVADAHNDEYPAKDSAWVTGDYSGLESVVAVLEEGRPARVVASRLDPTLRERYEQEGVKAELMAPIHIGERWVGTLGYTDHVREGEWTDVEVDGLMVAAEMIAAYWEREAAREGLMELAQAKDRFIATVSHELRTPLTAVVGFAAEMLSNGERLTGDELRELVALVHEQSVEVSQLVDDLLTAERAASGNLTIKTGEIDLLEECRDVVASVGGGRAIGTIGESVIALGDPLRTRQVIRNLLTNAIKHGGDAIQVEVVARDSTSCVVVRDNGPGVQGIDADRIFDPYYRAQHTDSGPDSVGLGLAVARQLARLMGGDIAYHRIDGWTYFDFTLPLVGTRSLALAE